ncbi:MAG: DUF885 domain-containing protein [Steroidobacteraceae bacterium]
MSAVGSEGDSSVALANLAQRFWAFRCYEEPLLAIQAGRNTADTVLFREGPEDFERRSTTAEVFLRQLVSIPENHLTVQEWATHRLLRRELEDIRSFHDMKLHERPTLFPYGPESITVDFANTATLITLEGAALYVNRLKTISAYFDDVVANLTCGYVAGFRYPRQVLASAAAAVRAHSQGAVEGLAWFSPFRRTSLSGAEIQRIAQETRELLASTLVPALRAYADFLEGPLAVGARDSVSCTDAPRGEEFYRILVRHFTTTNVSTDELHELGKAEVARLTSEMLRVAADAGFSGELSKYRAFLAADSQFIAPSREVLREQFEIVCKRIDLNIPAFFGRIPRITYGIQSIPEAASALLPPAYAQFNPADCSGPGVLWVTSIPAKAPRFMHSAVALHEGWPGHLMHMALIQEMQELPDFRRFAVGFSGSWRYSACLEGWALYCEGLGVEMGLYQTPHQHYGRLDMEIWRALRLVVDTGLHTRGWTRAQAVDYMAAHSALPRIAIESEVDRYIGMPAQALAYQVGNRKFWELRTRAERRLGRRFNVRTFHDTLMAAGAVTLPVLERLVEGYLEQSEGVQ